MEKEIIKENSQNDENIEKEIIKENSQNDKNMEKEIIKENSQNDENMEKEIIKENSQNDKNIVYKLKEYIKNEFLINIKKKLNFLKTKILKNKKKKEKNTNIQENKKVETINFESEKLRIIGNYNNLKEHQKMFIDLIFNEIYKKVYEHDIPNDKKDDIIKIAIAQAALETGWGKNEIMMKNNNLFGIKGFGKVSKFSTLTYEFVNGKKVRIKDYFKKYKTIEESIDDYLNIIAKKNIYDINDMLEKYSTSPNYIKLIKNIVNSLSGKSS